MKKISKPWGHELIWAETGDYVGKILYIKKGHRLSRQYHEKKEETIMVKSGNLIVEVGNPNDKSFERLNLGVDEVFHVYPKTIHRFCAGESDVSIVEVSTPFLDDVVRLDDDYKR